MSSPFRDVTNAANVPAQQVGFEGQLATPPKRFPPSGCSNGGPIPAASLHLQSSPVQAPSPPAGAFALFDVPHAVQDSPIISPPGPVNRKRQRDENPLADDLLHDHPALPLFPTSAESDSRIRGLDDHSKTLRALENTSASRKRWTRECGVGALGSSYAFLRGRESSMPIFAQPFRPSMRNYFSHFVSTEHNMYRFISEDTSYIPPFACAFANTSKHGHKLAVADEEGIIGIIDTNKDNRWEAEHARPQWLAHVNAIFDICWTSDDRQIASAAGDQTVRIWDVETARCTAIFQGHNCSIKSVANHPSNPHIFATAARDGRIMTWDTRSASIAPDAPESRYRPTNTINNAHALQKGPVKKTRGQSNPSQSVTSVRFMPHSEDTLASSGAADGLIKLWDLRSPAAFSRKDNPSPLSTSHVLDGNRRAHGFSSLCMDSIGSRIYAACTDNRIYEFDSSTLGKPIQKFSAAEYRCDTFYIKTTVSPDDRFLASGSSDHGLYIWEIDHPEKPPLVLRAHRGEVTGLSWSKQELSRIAACSDDATVRIWNVDLDYDEAEQDFAYRDYRGKAEEGKLRIEEEEASPAPKLITSQAVPSPVDQNNENEAPTSSNANLTSTPRAHVAGTPRSGLAARRTNSGPVNSLNRPNARNTPVRTIADYFASPTTTPST